MHYMVNRDYMDAETYRRLEEEVWNTWSEETKQAQPWYVDRDNSILTTRQREYLIGLADDMSTNQKTSTRAQIRRRVRDAIRDFRILNRQLEHDEIKEIINEYSEIDTNASDKEGSDVGLTDTERREMRKIIRGRPEQMGKIRDGNVNSCLKDIISFVYRYRGEVGASKVIEKGIKQSLRQSGWLAEVDVKLNIEFKETHDEAVRRLEEHGVTGYHPDKVKRTELRELLRAGAISGEEYQKYTQELREDLERRRVDDGSYGLFGDVSRESEDADEEE